MTKRMHLPPRSLIVPKAPRTQTSDPTVTAVELPTIEVTCPRPKTGPDSCPNAGNALPVVRHHLVSEGIIEFGYHCDGCGYESTLQLAAPNAARFAQ